MFSYIQHVMLTIMFMYQNKYNFEWDIKLNALIDTFGEEAQLDKHGYTISLGEFDVWIRNRWYSYGYAMYKDSRLTSSELQFRPKFRTMVRLHKLVVELESKRIQKGIKEIYG